MANGQPQVYDDLALRIALGDSWFQFCYAYTGEGGRVIRSYFKVCAHGLRLDTAKIHLRFLIKAILRRGYVPQKMKLGVE
jgi:hypothetical protein